MKPGQRVVYVNPDGSVAVAKVVNASTFAAQVEAPLLRAGARRVYEPTATEPLPDRRWRGCWRLGENGAVAVDMPLARAQRMAEIRAERERRLAASDGLMLRAQEQGHLAEAEALRVYRQTLRDLPKELAAAKTLEALETPEALGAFEPNWPEGMAT
jgi:hypothetical protein